MLDSRNGRVHNLAEAKWDAEKLAICGVREVASAYRDSTGSIDSLCQQLALFLRPEDRFHLYGGRNKVVRIFHLFDILHNLARGSGYNHIAVVVQKNQ
jgi:hypothetical protein